MEKKKKQTKQTHMDILLKRGTPPQEELQTDLSGGISEKGNIIIGNDRYMCHCSEDLPVG